MTELIIDISYKCNSNCRYCQWSLNNKTNSRNELPLDKLILSKENLKALEITRIVLSGGEPILSSNFKEIVNYYGKNNYPIRLLSNGIGLSSKKVKTNSNWGIKEYVISIDSLDYETYSKIQTNAKTEFQKILHNLRDLSILHQSQSQIVSFIGLNVVLTSVNCNWDNINQLISFAIEHKINQVKFQPVFDDGYLSKNASELALSREVIVNLEEITLNMSEKCYKNDFINPLQFWIDLKNYLNGIRLPPENCQLEEKTILLHDGVLEFCFWCQNIIYGPIERDYSKKEILKIRQRFKKNLIKCQVLPQCFCLQPINHSWHIKAK